MKRGLIALLLTAMLISGLASVAFAGGDQVRGELGQGTVKQVQVQDPPPFQP